MTDGATAEILVDELLSFHPETKDAGLIKDAVLKAFQDLREGKRPLLFCTPGWNWNPRSKMYLGRIKEQ